MFIATVTAMCSLGHGLRLIAVPRSTQPCITSGSLSQVPASAGVRAGMSPLPGGRSLCDPTWHVNSHSSDAGCLAKANHYNAFICFYFLCHTFAVLCFMLADYFVDS